MKKDIGRLLSLLVLSFWAGPAPAVPITDFVTLGDQQWAQPDDFTSLSWNQIFSVCGSGPCSGSLTSNSATYDMDGWTWASIEDFNGLVNGYIADAGGTATGYPLVGSSSADEIGSSWAPTFLQDFDQTLGDASQEGIFGWTSTPLDSSTAHWAKILDNLDAGRRDSTSTNSVSGKANAFRFVGSWFVRDAPSDVPVPATLGLFALAIATLGLTRRWKE